MRSRRRGGCCGRAASSRPAAISRFASAIDGLLKGYVPDPEFERIVESDLSTATT